MIVTAKLPASANVGDKIDVTVSSIGDARSLAGGTLLMTPLLGPDQRAYALAQGSLVTGGHSFDSRAQQPTAQLSDHRPRSQGGATVERAVDASILTAPMGAITFLLSDPDFATASADRRAAINARSAPGVAVCAAMPTRSGSLSPAMRPSLTGLSPRKFESSSSSPIELARVVINERTGHGRRRRRCDDLKRRHLPGRHPGTVTGDRYASQPASLTASPATSQSLVVTNTRLDVDEGAQTPSFRFPNTSVADLVQALSRARVNTRRTIAILQAIKAAGALHADIIVQ